MEQWKKIPNYNGFVSNLGRVKKANGKLRKLNNHKLGYKLIALQENGKTKTHLVHRLVAEMFIDNPNNKTEVNHKDGNKSNNNVNNLEWATRSENIKHALRTGLIVRKKRDEVSFSKLTTKQIKEIKRLHKPYSKEFGTRVLAKQYGVSEMYLSTIINN